MSTTSLSLGKKISNLDQKALVEFERHVYIKQIIALQIHDITICLVHNENIVQYDTDVKEIIQPVF